MPEVMTPVAVEARLHTLAQGIAEGVDRCDRAYREFLAADHAFDLAEAHAYFAATGTEVARKMRVRIVVETERNTRDVAEAAWRYTDRKARALEAEMRALQSIGASVRESYRTVGHAERT